MVGLELIALAEFGRPRIDITVRISGFFRDALPDSFASSTKRSNSSRRSTNRVRTTTCALCVDDPRIFDPGPGSYGAGILHLLEQRNRRSDDDLAAVYMAWSDFGYGRQGFSVPAPDAMRRRFAIIDVAVKNQDNREHGVFDSDEYIQEHGGIIATIRSLPSRTPQTWFGDTADPSHLEVRSLAEAAARVVRTRVVNPKYVAAMRQHDYKGAFEMVATVDYLSLRLRRDRARRWRLDVRARHRRVRGRSRSAEVLRTIQSVGAHVDCRAVTRSS